MKVSGNAVLKAAPEQVWAALNDPAVLVRTIPGCEQLETVGPDHYRMTVTAGVASVRGTYVGEVSLADHVPYSAFTLRANGAGAPGTVGADVRVTLTPQTDGSTLLGYDADAVVGGTVGGVGQRVLGGVARRLAGEFFTAVDAHLTDAALPEPAAAPPAAIGGPATDVAAVDGMTATMPGGGPAPTVFTRPPATRGGGRTVQVDVRDQLPAALVGALIALLGVLVGWRIARRP